jgi:hypothetical protein
VAAWPPSIVHPAASVGAVFFILSIPSESGSLVPARTWAPPSPGLCAEVPCPPHARLDRGPSTSFLMGSAVLVDPSPWGRIADESARSLQRSGFHGRILEANRVKEGGGERRVSNRLKLCNSRPSHTRTSQSWPRAAEFAQERQDEECGFNGGRWM